MEFDANLDDLHMYACIAICNLQAIGIDIFGVLIKRINAIKEMANALRIRMLDIL